jgi:hypothetical protein
MRGESWLSQLRDHGLLDWDTLGKHFYLLDTFKGMDEMAGALEKNHTNLVSGFYTIDIEQVRKNFANGTIFR